MLLYMPSDLCEKLSHAKIWLADMVLQATVILLLAFYRVSAEFLYCMTLLLIRRFCCRDRSIIAVSRSAD